MTASKKLLFMALIPLAIVLAGVALLAFGGRDLMRARASESWPSVPGRIEESKVDEEYRNSGGNATTHYLAAVRYQYAVDGATHHGARIHFGDATSTIREDVQAIVDRYPPGQEVSVHYQPEQPDVAVLEPGARGSTYLVPVIAAVLIVVGLAFPFMVRYSSANQAASAAKS